MGDAIRVLGALIIWVLDTLVRLLWSGLKIIVIVGVIVGAADQILAQAPISWPQFAFSFGTFFDYLTLTFETVTRSWLPLGVAIIVIWTWQTRSEISKISTDVVQVKIAIVALMNYLEVGVETEVQKEIEDKGWKRAILEAWKVNLALTLLTGQVQDDALTAKPTRLHPGSEITFRDDIRYQVEAALESRG